MADSMESKKHPATQLKRRRADQEGVFPRSQEWSVALVWLAGVGFLQWGGPRAFGFFSGMLAQQIRAVEPGASSRLDWHAELVRCGVQGMLAIAPMLLGLLCVSLAVHFAQAGFRWSPQRMVLEWGRLVPNADRWLGPEVFVRLFQGGLRLVVIVTVFFWGVRNQMAEISAWGQLPLVKGFEAAWSFLLGLGWSLGFGWLLLAGLDFGWQWWSNERKLRMTDSEMREELKESQGDPQMRAKRRRIVS
jgi:flagellar biosynthetic protein FlhB